MTILPHGTRTRYMSGCRCIPCRAANSTYQVKRNAARKSGNAAGLVTATKTRKHLQALKRAGIGKRLVSAASGISQFTIAQIRNGEKRFIRASTEREILRVDRNLKGSASLVSAKATWKRIEELREEGFTEAQLAKRLGYTCGKIQFDGEMVTARTEQKVARLHREVMEES